MGFLVVCRQRVVVVRLIEAGAGDRGADRLSFVASNGVIAGAGQTLLPVFRLPTRAKSLPAAKVGRRA
jgi:hypothetical protein